jgi:FAD:protein FMN transferase
MIRTLTFRAMGCQMLAALDTEALRWERILSAVPAWFEAWEQCLSRFRPDSELNELNRRAGQPYPVSPTLWQVFQAALEAERRSQGLATPLVLGALVQAGYDRSFVELEGSPAGGREAAGSPPGPILPAISITWEAATRTICLPHGAGIDFGGIAKGWAAQQAVHRLRAYGPALVNAGGDIAVSGAPHDGQGWTIGIADPFCPELDLGVLHLSNASVATSGIDHRRWQQGGVWQHHLIDPRTGTPAQTDLVSVTVIAPSVLEAETAAKVALIEGSRAGLAWLEAQPGLAGLLIGQDQQRRFTRHFQDYLKEG